MVLILEKVSLRVLVKFTVLLSIEVASANPQKQINAHPNTSVNCENSFTGINPVVPLEKETDYYQKYQRKARQLKSSKLLEKVEANDASLTLAVYTSAAVDVITDTLVLLANIRRLPPVITGRSPQIMIHWQFFVNAVAHAMSSQTVRLNVEKYTIQALSNLTRDNAGKQILDLKIIYQSRAVPNNAFQRIAQSMENDSVKNIANYIMTPFQGVNGISSNNKFQTESLLGVSRITNSSGLLDILKDLGSYLDDSGDAASAVKKVRMVLSNFSELKQAREILEAEGISWSHVSTKFPSPDFDLLHAYLIAGGADLTGEQIRRLILIVQNPENNSNYRKVVREIRHSLYLKMDADTISWLVSTPEIGPTFLIEFLFSENAIETNAVPPIVLSILNSEWLFQDTTKRISALRNFILSRKAWKSIKGLISQDLRLATFVHVYGPNLADAQTKSLANQAFESGDQLAVAIYKPKIPLSKTSRNASPIVPLANVEVSNKVFDNVQILRKSIASGNAQQVAEALELPMFKSGIDAEYLGGIINNASLDDQILTVIAPKSSISDLLSIMGANNGASAINAMRVLKIKLSLGQVSTDDQLGRIGLGLMDKLKGSVARNSTQYSHIVNLFYQIMNEFGDYFSSENEEIYLDIHKLILEHSLEAGNGAITASVTLVANLENDMLALKLYGQIDAHLEFGKGDFDLLKMQVLPTFAKAKIIEHVVDIQNSLSEGPLAILSSILNKRPGLKRADVLPSAKAYLATLGEQDVRREVIQELIGNIEQSPNEYVHNYGIAVSSVSSIDYQRFMSMSREDFDHEIYGLMLTREEIQQMVNEYWATSADVDTNAAATTGLPAPIHQKVIERSEMISMLLSIRYELERGNIVFDVSNEARLGYDLVSFDLRSGKVSVIEVKGKRSPKTPLVLSQKQLHMSMEWKDNFEFHIWYNLGRGVATFYLRRYTNVSFPSNVTDGTQTPIFSYEELENFSIDEKL